MGFLARLMHLVVTSVVVTQSAGLRALEIDDLSPLALIGWAQVHRSRRVLPLHYLFEGAFQLLLVTKYQDASQSFECSSHTLDQ